MTGDIDKAVLAALREELAFPEFLDDLMDWGHATARREKDTLRWMIEKVEAL